jgi:uncharacterized protein YndB with AHSA1/START domain
VPTIDPSISTLYKVQAMPSILHQFEIQSEPEMVFDAFSSPAGLNAWWTLESDGKPELNETYRFFFGPEYDWRAVVAHLVPGRELIWKVTQAMDDWMPTSFGFRLRQSAVGTTVDFFHIDWAEANDHFAITTFCWGQLLQGLKGFVEHGTVIPFEKRN